MKQFLMCLLFLIPITIITAQVPTKDGKAFYEVVDSSVTGSKQELQVKAKMWMANAFKDAKEVIQLDDKDAGEVLGKGNVSIGYMSQRCRFTIKISTRDNKYRCQIYDLAIMGSRSSSDMPIEYYIQRPKGIGSRAVLKNTDEQMRQTLAELNQAMKKASDNF